jgi:hypothetical protein
MALFTRRSVIAGVAALPVFAVVKTSAGSMADPIIAAIVARRAARNEFLAARDAFLAERDAYCDLLKEHERLAISGTRSATEVTRYGFTTAELRLQTAAELRMQLACEAMIAAERTLDGLCQQQRRAWLH